MESGSQSESEQGRERRRLHHSGESNSSSESGSQSGSESESQQASAEVKDRQPVKKKDNLSDVKKVNKARPVLQTSLLELYYAGLKGRCRVGNKLKPNAKSVVYANM